MSTCVISTSSTLARRCESRINRERLCRQKHTIYADKGTYSIVGADARWGHPQEAKTALEWMNGQQRAETCWNHETNLIIAVLDRLTGEMTEWLRDWMNERMNGVWQCVPMQFYWTSVLSSADLTDWLSARPSDPLIFWSTETTVLISWFWPADLLSCFELLISPHWSTSLAA